MMERLDLGKAKFKNLGVPHCPEQSERHVQTSEQHSSDKGSLTSLRSDYMETNP